MAAAYKKASMFRTFLLKNILFHFSLFLSYFKSCCETSASVQKWLPPAHW